MQRDIKAGLLVAAVALICLAEPARAQLPADSTPQQPKLESKLQPGANSFVESQARDLLLQKGYSDVSPLMNGENGMWHGRAIKNGHSVEVTVDYLGHVGEK